MNTAVTLNTGDGSANGKPSQFDRAQRMRIGVAVGVLVLVLAAGFFFSRQTDWQILFTNLSDKDMGTVTAQLSQSGVPYRLAEGGSIQVASDKVHEVRIRLASQGLPKGSLVGFELMDNPRLGITQFQERLSFQRGLEGELTRSIQAIGSVQAARVHLALPRQNGFYREQQKPSASVLVMLQPGMGLDRAQVSGIVHLVSSSVPELDAKAVSVIDGSGNLLSMPPDVEGGVDTQQLQYVRQLEQSFAQRIQDILAPIVGPNNVRAQVTVAADFTRTETTAESHEPNQQGGAIRSQQITENSDAAPGQAAAGGIPGAASNQPGLADPKLATATGARGRRESITNYEVDRAVNVVRKAAGSIKRVSAAVVVNYANKQDEEGVNVPSPLDATQLEQMRALVRDAIGFEEARGDSVNVMNAPFAVEKFEVPFVSWWERPEVHTMVKLGTWLGGLVLLAILLLIAMVRPAMLGIRKPPAEFKPLLNAVVAEAPARPALPPPAPAVPAPEPVVFVPVESDQRLKAARDLSIESPAAVAGIVKAWMQSDNA